MSLSKADVLALRWPVAMLALAIALAGAVGVAGVQALAKAEREGKVAGAQKSESQAKLSQVAAEEQELRDKIGRFGDLRAKGYIGTENRLDWIELIGRLSAKHRLYDFEYEFLPQRPIEPLLLPGVAAAGGHRFLSSPQTFTARVLHEGDVVAFLEELRKSAPALLVIRACEIKRLPPARSERGPQPNLDASCRLEWVTLQEPR